jgi:hypothetical protein
MNASAPRWQEEILKARLKNPQIRAAILSPKIPYKKAVVLITGYKRTASALKQFDEFLEHVDQFSDPNIPLKLRMEKGERPAFTLAWCEDGIPGEWIEPLTKYFRKFREDKESELQRERGERTAFKKKK